VLACAGVALCLGPGVAPAAAATSIGQLDPGTPTGSCVGTSGWVQSAEAGTPTYVVPGGNWVIVSWSHRANAAAGRELGVRVWRTTTTAGTYTLVGTAPLRILTPGGINTFYERVPVTGGDILGLRVGNPPGPFPDLGGGASCAFTAAAGNSVRYGLAANEPGVGSSSALAALLPLYRLNVTARLEPDADSDGYGDETQDSCPGSAGASAGCGPAAPAPGKDTTAPVAKLISRRDSIRDGRIAIWVTANEAARVTAKGALSIGGQARVHRLRAVTAHVVASKRERMLLRLSRKTRRAARRALRRRKPMRVQVSVTLRDAAGNTSTAKRAVRLRR
jgi:hypothetical protein